MESYIPISYLNDFIFCPRSIYYHQLYQKFDKKHYQNSPQTKGTLAHKSIDQNYYSNRTEWLTGIYIYSNTYQLCGKIDLYNTKTNVLRERKNKITTLYDGYIFQVYAQYFCLKEMGYEVKAIEIYDMSHNKNYPIPIPEQDQEMLDKFEKTINNLQNFKLSDPFLATKAKCENCIYSELCDQSLC